MIKPFGSFMGKHLISSQAILFTFGQTPEKSSVTTYPPTNSYDVNSTLLYFSKDDIGSE